MASSKERQPTPPGVIADLAKRAEAVARTARKHRQPLGGSNFYAEKLASLRADATITFRQLSSSDVGDVSVLSELLDTSFSPSATPAARRDAVRDLCFQLKTKWTQNAPTPPPGEDDAIFPLSLLTKTGRGYLVQIARQMNGSFALGWYDACAVMMRRLVETSIIEAYEARGLQAKIKNANGDYFQLTELVKHALAEPTFHPSRNTKTHLPQLRDVGHMSAHGRYFTAQKSDIEKVRQGCRVVVEEFLHIAKLL
jgi:hypothetical protein